VVVANNGLQHEPDGHGVSSVTKLGDGGRRVGVVEWKLMGDPSSVFSTSLRVLHNILIRPSHEIAKVGVADALRCVALRCSWVRWVGEVVGEVVAWRRGDGRLRRARKHTRHR